MRRGESTLMRVDEAEGIICRRGLGEMDMHIGAYSHVNALHGLSLPITQPGNSAFLSELSSLPVETAGSPILSPNARQTEITCEVR